MYLDARSSGCCCCCTLARARAVRTGSRSSQAPHVDGSRRGSITVDGVLVEIMGQSLRHGQRQVTLVAADVQVANDIGVAAVVAVVVCSSSCGLVERRNHHVTQQTLQEGQAVIDRVERAVGMKIPKQWPPC